LKPACCTHHYSGPVVNPPTQLEHGLGQLIAQDQFKIAGGSNEFVGMSGALGEHQAVLCGRTGKIYWRSEYSGPDELNDELPDDVEDEEYYVAIPDKQERGLSKSLAFEFAREFLLNDFDVAAAISPRSVCRQCSPQRRMPVRAWRDLLDPLTAFGWQPAVRATCGTPSSPPPDAQRSVAGRVGPAYP
jgi:hypothetical protein